MLPELPRELYRHSGPFASVYTDVSRDHHDSPHEIELRWKELARSLAEQGAGEDDIRAIGAVVTEATGSSGPVGRAVIASGGRVHLDVVLPDRPRREIAQFSVLPHVMPLLTQLPEPIPYVTVDLGRTTAVVHTAPAHGPESEVTEHGSTENTHKIRGDVGQGHTEEKWAENVRAFAGTVDDAVARLSAKVLVVTGDVRARAMLLEALGERSRSLAVESEGAPPDDTTTGDQPNQRVAELVAQCAAERSREVLDSVNTAHGRDTGLAASGLHDVVSALQQGQVETLVIRDDPASALELWVGPEPTDLADSEENLRDLTENVLGRDRADAALVRAAAGTGARLLVLAHPDAAQDPAHAGSAAGSRGFGPTADEGPDLADGVGAVLRFSTPDA